MPLIVGLVHVGGPLLLTVVALIASSLTRERVDTRHGWTWVRFTWAAAAVIGGLVAWLLDSGLDLGRGTMLVPEVLGLSSSLAPRQVVDYLPLAITFAALHLAALALTMATASAEAWGVLDDRSHASAAGWTSVVRRPRGFAPDDVADDVLRHRSATRILAAAGAGSRRAARPWGPTPAAAPAGRRPGRGCRHGRAHPP